MNKIRQIAKVSYESLGFGPTGLGYLKLCRCHYQPTVWPNLAHSSVFSERRNGLLTTASQALPDLVASSCNNSTPHCSAGVPPAVPSHHGLAHPGLPFPFLVLSHLTLVIWDSAARSVPCSPQTESCLYLPRLHLHRPALKHTWCYCGW